MEFKDIASVSGKGGLFKIVKPTRSGVILETMDDKKARMVTGMDARVSVLDEISIYTNTKDGSVPLKDVMQKIFKEFDADPGVDSKSSPEELKAFLKHILPEFDETRVYNSDIKKLVSWYKTLHQHAPELLKEEKKTKAKTTKKKKSEGEEEQKASE